MSTITQTLSLDSSLPSGGWTLYFHPAKEIRWHIDTFRVVAKMKTFRDLANLFAAFTPSDWIRGKFFFCPDGTLPLMENAKNIRGGSYSFLVDRSNAGPIYRKYILAAILGKIFLKEGDQIACVRITPRRDYNILQVWNRDCQKFSSPEGLAILDSGILSSAIKYVPHVEKKI